MFAKETAKVVADGLNELYDAGKEAKVDIVFVHGLRGHPQYTWETVNPDPDAEEADKVVFWPKALLPGTIKDCRIFSYGYPTDFATFYPIITPGSISHMSIDNHSTSLMHKLGNVRQHGTATRPIIFIAHSLGGLVTANGLASDYTSDAQGQEVVNHTCGAIFLGTPFKGSSKAPWATLAEKVLGIFGDSNDQTIQDLDKSSKKLQQISVDFLKLLQTRFSSKELRPIQVACFFETKSTIKSWKKIKKDLGQIVTSESASLPGYKPIGINATHSLMCKFSDDQDQGYIDVTGAIKLMISNLDKKKEDLKNSAQAVITFGDFKQGDRVINIGGYVTGPIVGTTENAVTMSLSNNFHGPQIPESAFMN
ncbi:SesB protein [Leptodontidium sp. 2 PMI_412]|nr:SesB protein [Leptodontidium sp. 2 PMI_412]